MLSCWLDPWAPQLIEHGAWAAGCFSPHTSIPWLLLPIFSVFSDSQRPKSPVSAVFHSLRNTVIMLHLINNKIVEMQGSSDIY